MQPQFSALSASYEGFGCDGRDWLKCCTSPALGEKNHSFRFFSWSVKVSNWFLKKSFIIKIIYHQRHSVCKENEAVFVVPFRIISTNPWERNFVWKWRKQYCNIFKIVLENLKCVFDCIPYCYHFFAVIIYALTSVIHTSRQVLKQ